ncbi:hypothetical protein [Aurantimonas sp. 22II-16-19i]|uniref:hypothetical protein n=1 Tax=Aurantimonas sp. 22II-16-19i TaxID=1317114 RepID=UPI0015935F6B|nr:hypothetical protein [Aurantimonas sp. 22II-16-19i]
MTHTQVVQGSNGDWTITLPDQITLTQVGGNAVITDGFNTITLNGVAIGDLDATDFIF